MMNKENLPHIITAVSFAVFIVLGLACASGPPPIFVRYSEPARLDMSGINRIAVVANDAQIVNTVSQRLIEGKYTVSPPQELQAWEQWKGQTGAQQQLYAQQNAAPAITAADLVGAYSANPARADGLYAGKLLKISGAVKEIGQSARGNYFVRLGVGNDGVDLFFASSETGKIASINKGNTITVFGICNGYKQPTTEDSGEIVRLLGGGRSVNIVDARFPAGQSGDYTGTLPDAIVMVTKKPLSVQDTNPRAGTRIVSYSDGSYGEVEVTIYDRAATLNIDYQILRIRDDSIIGQGTKSSTWKNSGTSSELPNSAKIEADIINKPLMEITAEMVPTERSILVTLLQADKNDKEAKKEMKEAEKLVATANRGGDYRGAAAAYGAIYAKYKNFEAGYNQAVLTEATEGTTAAIDLMEAVIANEANGAKKSTAQAALAEMRKRDDATQAAQEQLSR